jgi:predicted DsbA family dithiol-disulfide isomerase
LEDEWLPLEIHPDTPREGADFTQRFPAPQLRMMIDNLNEAGRQYGIEFKPFKVLPNSHLALAAGEYAKEKGKFHQVHHEVFKTYFTEGKDIGQLQTILAIAAKVGLDSEDLLKRLQEGKYENALKEAKRLARQNGIDSTPTFIIDNKYEIVGAQPIENFREALRQIEAEEN